MARRSLVIVISNNYLSNQLIGYISAALYTSTIFLLFSNAFMLVIFPEFSYRFGMGDESYIRKLLNNSTLYISSIMSLIIGLAIVLSRDLIVFFYTEDYVDAAPLLQLLLASFWVNILATPSISVLSATRYVHIPNLSGIAGLVLSIVIWIFLIPIVGAQGAVIGYLMGSILMSIIPLLFAIRYFNLSLDRNLGVIALCFMLFIVLGIMIEGKTTDTIIRYLVAVGLVSLYIVINYKNLSKVCHALRSTLRRT